MRSGAERILLSVILVSLLTLIGIAVGVVAPIRASGPAGTQPVTVPATPAPGVTHVFIRTFAYQPTNIQVVWGTAVTWTNQDRAVHSVVLPHSNDAATDIRESGPLSQGQSFTSPFLLRGTFQYSCIEHPSMVGIVTVTSPTSLLSYPSAIPQPGISTGGYSESVG